MPIVHDYAVHACNDSVTSFETLATGQADYLSITMAAPGVTSVPTEAERVADRVGVDAEPRLRVEVAGAEADGAVVGGVEIVDHEVDVQLLLDVGPRPRRGDEVGGPLERELRAPTRRHEVDPCRRLRVRRRGQSRSWP